ncbi:MAG: hypothetical protein JNK90_10005 [Planctomycetaceae bacterium]|nr:hypothetical protein [Planctomycetaceae bacterium]
MNSTRTLNQLKNLLPGDTPGSTDGEYGFESLNAFIDQNEPELALGALVYIAESHVDSGTMLDPQFWTTAKQLGEQLMALNRTTTFSDALADIMLVIDSHCASRQP